MHTRLISSLRFEITQYNTVYFSGGGGRTLFELMEQINMFTPPFPFQFEIHTPPDVADSSRSFYSISRNGHGMKKKITGRGALWWDRKGCRYSPYLFVNQGQFIRSPNIWGILSPRWWVGEDCNWSVVSTFPPSFSCYYFDHVNGALFNDSFQ